MGPSDHRTGKKQVMRKLISIAAAVALMAAATPSHAMLVVANLVDATNGGGFFGRITFQDAGTNTVSATADISSPINAGITRGDILGLWFDFATLVPTSVTIAPGVIDARLNPNSVSNSPFRDRNVSLNGSGPGGWDFAIQTGESGPAGGYLQTVTYTFRATGLSANEFAGQRVGMRVQSIEGVPGFTAGSSKLLLGNGVPIAEPGVLGLLLISMGVIGTAIRRRAS
jgi:hypothetical protein